MHNMPAAAKMQAFFKKTFALPFLRLLATRYGTYKKMTMFQINEEKIEIEFVRLAELILLEKQLIVNEARFNFTEIEFYFYTKTHQDSFTHEHKMEAGKWRFHNQGFDVTLRSENGFGGILIRGVEYAGKFTNGPRRVLFEVMQYLNGVTEVENKIGIISKEKENLKIFNTFRHGLDKPSPNLKCDNPDYFKKAKYRFIVKPQSFDRKQFADSEVIAKGFNNSNLSKEFLGYEIKQ